MIRRVQLNLNYANTGKLEQLDELMVEALRVLNEFVDVLWAQKKFSGSFASLKTDTWLSARMQQCLGKQALEGVKSQRKRRKKTKPRIGRPVLNLDQRFLKFGSESNHFDFWIKLGSLGRRIKLNLPSKKHSHLNKFILEGWQLKKSGRLRKAGNGWFLDVYVEKDEVPKKAEGETIGVDCGYKELLVCSDGRKADEGLEKTYEKIARKKQGSNAFKRALTERDQLINRTVNRLDISAVKTLVVERLKNVKKNSKGKIRKSFNNKLQRWSYVKCFDKLQSVCEESGIDLLEINPAYTSQTCSCCGHVDRKSRKGKCFLCTGCGASLDADYNAARNILMRGIYSSSPVKAVP